MIQLSAIRMEVASFQKAYNVSSVKSVKYLPSRIPSNVPYLKEVYRTPPGFDAVSIFCSVPFSSSLGRWRMDAHAQMPSYLFFSHSSLNSILCTWMPVYSDALIQISSNPSDCLIWNDPAAYVELILDNEVEKYLKKVTRYIPLSSLR